MVGQKGESIPGNEIKPYAWYGVGNSTLYTGTPPGCLFITSHRCRISSTVAVMSGPQDLNAAPSLHIALKMHFPFVSMKVTPHRSTIMGLGKSPVSTSCQVRSSSVAEGAANLPSTLMPVPSWV